MKLGIIIIIIIIIVSYSLLHYGKNYRIILKIINLFTVFLIYQKLKSATVLPGLFTPKAHSGYKHLKYYLIMNHGLYHKTKNLHK